MNLPTIFKPIKILRKSFFRNRVSKLNLLYAFANLIYLMQIIADYEIRILQQQCFNR